MCVSEKRCSSLTGNLMAPDWRTPAWREWCCISCSQRLEALHGFSLLSVSYQCLYIFVANYLIACIVYDTLKFDSLILILLSCRPLKAWISKHQPSASQKSDMSSKGLSLPPSFLIHDLMLPVHTKLADRIFVFVHFFFKTQTWTNIKFCLFDGLNNFLISMKTKKMWESRPVTWKVLVNHVTQLISESMNGFLDPWQSAQQFISFTIQNSKNWHLLWGWYVCPCSNQNTKLTPWEVYLAYWIL